ncbi:DNA helicase [Tanacetum coccineum]|uniref:DNA helicase n=1 Tax=Tanacetum coccineum TaxID=301880 RepID=A0ABQ5EHI7_9ASTR
MNNRRCFEALDRSLRDLMDTLDLLFGGKRQNIQLLKPSLAEEEQRRSQEFADWLLHVGDGELRKPDEEDADDTSVEGEITTYLSNDQAIPASKDTSKIEMLYPPEYLNTIKFPGFSPHELYLKVGSPMMLLRNVNLSGGLCNGTRMIVRSLSPLQAQILPDDVVIRNHSFAGVFGYNLTVKQIVVN